MAVVPFDKHRFRSAAAHYVEGRPPYASRLIALVVRQCGIGPAARLLDLGCGPGMLALAFAPHVGEVMAVDPEPEMLARGIEAAAQAGVANIRFVEGSSVDLGPLMGQFQAAVIGRAFHWMDRAETLRRLDGMLPRDGTVALFGDDHPDVPDNAWRAEWRTILDAHQAEGSARSRRRGPGWVRHEAVLLDSAFPVIEEVSVIERRQTPATRMVDRALSMSSTSPQRLEDGGQALAGAVRMLMAQAAPEGTLTEVVRTTALIARRRSMS